MMTTKQAKPVEVSNQFGSNAFLLTTHLEAIVPLVIADYVQQGGPSELDFARARNDYPWQLGSHGDSILYRTKEKTAKMISLLVDGLAILAFVPGGVTAFGLHFEANVPEADEVLAEQ